MPGRTNQQFETYAPDVYGWAYRFLGHHHDALDVVQDVYLKWSEQCTQNPPRNPRGWLRRVTLNRVVDWHRRRACRDVRERTLRADARRDGASEPDEGVARDAEELRADVSAALADLTQMQRTVLVAKVFDGAVFAEIAEELGLAVPTVKTHYMRAVRALRSRLQHRWERRDDSETSRTTSAR